MGAFQRKEEITNQSNRPQEKSKGNGGLAQKKWEQKTSNTIFSAGRGGVGCSSKTAARKGETEAESGEREKQSLRT